MKELGINIEGLDEVCVHDEIKEFVNKQISKVLYPHIPESRTRVHLFYNISIRMDDLNCLKPNRCLSDIIINGYLAFLFNTSNRNIGFTTTFFLPKLIRDGPKNGKQWAGLKSIPLTEYESFLIPVTWKSHWTLFHLQPSIHQIKVLDSFWHHNDETLVAIQHWLGYLGFPQFKVSIPHVPRQNNGVDCGVFLLQFARCIFYDYDLQSFGQKDIPALRKLIISELSPYVKDSNPEKISLLVNGDKNENSNLIDYESENSVSSDSDFHL